MFGDNFTIFYTFLHNIIKKIQKVKENFSGTKQEVDIFIATKKHIQP